MKQVQPTAFLRACVYVVCRLPVPAVLLILLFGGCSKNSDPEDGKDHKSRTELLTAGSWKLNAWTISPGVDWDLDGEKENNIYALLAACEKDDVMTFKANGDVLLDSKTLCEGDPGPGQATDKWKFTGDENGIITGTGSDATTYTILELTANRFKLSETYTEDGVTYTSETVLIR